MEISSVHDLSPEHLGVCDVQVKVVREFESFGLVGIVGCKGKVTAFQLGIVDVSGIPFLKWACRPRDPVAFLMQHEANLPGPALLTPNLPGPCAADIDAGHGHQQAY